jgi:gluconolactonase
MTIKRTFVLPVTFALLAASCKNAQTDKPAWSDLNQQVIAQYNVKGRTRTDIPDTKLSSNLEGGKVTPISSLPNTELAKGITAKAYWGKGALMSFITMEPNAAFPESKVAGERFLYVLEGNVTEWVGDKQTPLKATPRDNPDGIHGATPVREFVYLQKDAKTAVTAGANGAKILEVFSPLPKDYLEKAGVKDIPEPISLDDFPIAPSVEPNKVYNLFDLQMAELVPGSNSRIVSGKGVQMSFLRMDAKATFARHIHPEEQVMYTWRGWIDEILLDKTVRMKTGDIVDLPSNFVHGGELGPEGCDVMDVFFPPRTDYNSFRVHRDSGYYAIIPQDATVQTVIDGSATKPGLTFTEGPAWLGGKLYFSNMFFDKDFKGSPAKSTLVEMNPDGSYHNVIAGKMQTNGLLAAPDGSLIVCDMFGHRLLRMDTKGNILKVLADKYEGKALDGPNDLVMDAKGGIYFSDPQFTGDAVKNQPGRTVYYLAPDGKLTRLLPPNDFAMPNGLALSPDGKTLYINNTYDDEKFWNVNSDKDNYVWAYDVKDDGTIANPRKFALLHLTEQVLDRDGKSSGADGMRVDEKGNVWVATWAGMQIFNPQGKFIGIINFPTYPVNCAFGGPDGQTLYVTSYNKIYSIRTNVKGLSRQH